VLVIDPAGRDEVPVRVLGTTTIYKDGSTVGLSALRVGDSALAVYRTEGDVKIAVSITAQSPQLSVQGWLSQVDARGIITIRGADGRPYVLKVEPQSRLTLGGRPISFEQLDPGHQVIVSYSPPEGRDLGVVIKLDAF
jgi:hypothetical protein